MANEIRSATKTSQLRELRGSRGGSGKKKRGEDAGRGDKIGRNTNQG